METIFITESELSLMPELLAYMGFDEEAISEIKENGDVPDFLQNDPDYISCELGKIPFEEFQFEDVRYILTPPHLCEEYTYLWNDKYLTEKQVTRLMSKCKRAIERFFSDDFKTYFKSVNNTWDEFYSHNTAIAYRGGKGYCYGISKYVGK